MWKPSLPFAALLALASLLPVAASAEEYVRGRVDRDGTFVDPHWRSSWDRTYNRERDEIIPVEPQDRPPGTDNPTFSGNRYDHRLPRAGLPNAVMPPGYSGSLGGSPVGAAPGSAPVPLGFGSAAGPGGLVAVPPPRGSASPSRSGTLGGVPVPQGFQKH